MEINAKEAKDGARWFYLAGLVAVLFSYFLFSVDEGLTHSTRDKVLGETLRELRTAQTTLGSESLVDPRIVNSNPAAVAHE